MKKIIILSLLPLLFACNNKEASKVGEPIDTTSFIINHSEIPVCDTVYIYSGSNQVTDSLKTALFLANYKIEKVRYYLNICLRNPSQDKFLKGWIRRAIE